MIKGREIDYIKEIFIERQTGEDWEVNTKKFREIGRTV